jgi:hypothetical protein
MTVSFRVAVLTLSIMLLFGTGVLGLANPAFADLQLLEPDPTVGATFCGNGGFSSDGLGQTGGLPGTIQADVPAGSTVEQAYLYAASYFTAPDTVDVNFDGTVYTLAKLPNDEWAFGDAYRTDVTTQVATTVGGGGGTTDFIVTYDSNVLNGVALVVIFSNDGLPFACVSVFDGALNTPPQQTTLGFAGPVDTTITGFSAEMIAGSAHSFQGEPGHICGSSVAQSTIIDINGERLSSCLGNYDDGLAENGALMTVGGVGDDLLNPDDPNQQPADGALPRTMDDERYSIASFINNGDTQVDIDTQNPSGDDHVFLVIISITAKTSADEICGNGIDDDGDGLIDEGCTSPPPNDCSDENVLLADAGVIGIGGTTDLTQKIDTCGGLTGEIKSWTVVEADGDTCAADDLPATIPASGELTREYPTEFSIAVSNGDGTCDTGDVGIFTSETQVEINGVVEKFTHEFETNFFVIPESPIGIAALLGTSLAALGAVLYLKKRSSRHDGIGGEFGLGI